MEHGTAKVLDFPHQETHKAFYLITLNPGAQGLIELIGGFLFALGLFTRPVAFILAGDVAVAYFMAHAPRGFLPLLNGGELAIVYCFTFLYFWVAGGGEWSLDRVLRRGTPSTSTRPMAGRGACKTTAGGRDLRADGLPVPAVEAILRGAPWRHLAAPRAL